MKLIKATTKSNEANRKATICYTHITRTNFPQELENLIENVEMYSAIPANGATVCAFTCTFKDKVAITIRHLLKDNVFVKNLEKLFKETKLKYELKEVQPRENVSFKYI